MKDLLNIMHFWGEKRKEGKKAGLLFFQIDNISFKGQFTMAYLGAVVP